MKKNKTIFIKIIPSLLAFSILILPQLSSAAALQYKMLEPNAFPGVSTSGNDLPTFLTMAFQFGLAIAAILAVIMIIWGGVETMLSESVFGKDAGRQKIWDAVLGLGLALVSWLILYTINPNLVIFRIS